MKSANKLDSTIPVLTEVISLNAAQHATLQPEPVTDVKEEPNQRQLHPSSPYSPDQEQLLAQLEKTLHEKVLNQLLTRVDFVLEHRIRDGLAEVLQSATDELAQNIRQGLAKSLDEIIHRAITQEISKILSVKTK